MKRDRWLFLTKLIAGSLLLGWTWFAWGQTAWPDLLRPFAVPIFKLFGVKRWLTQLLMHHYTSIVPFLVLVLATPGHRQAWRKGLVALVGGTTVVVLGHLLMSVAVFHIVDAYGLGKMAYRLTVPIYLINDSLPLVLWLLLYHDALRRLFPLLRFGGNGRKSKDNSRAKK